MRPLGHGPQAAQCTVVVAQVPQVLRVAVTDAVPADDHGREEHDEPDVVPCVKRTRFHSNCPYVYENKNTRTVRVSHAARVGLRADEVRVVADCFFPHRDVAKVVLVAVLRLVDVEPQRRAFFGRLALILGSELRQWSALGELPLVWGFVARVFFPRHFLLRDVALGRRDALALLAAARAVLLDGEVSLEIPRGESTGARRFRPRDVGRRVRGRGAEGGILLP